MDDKTHCQSCGLPLGESFANFGTELDGSASAEYCTLCYQNGSFTNPEQTVDGMVASSVDFMTANLGYSVDEATDLSNNVIRKLRRWR
jgi:Putative zinc ribbon domain